MAQIGEHAAMPSTYSLTILRRHANHFCESTPETSGVEYMEYTLDFKYDTIFMSDLYGIYNSSPLTRLVNPMQIS